MSISSFGSLGTIWAEMGLKYSGFDAGVDTVIGKLSVLDRDTQSRLRSIGRSFDTLGKTLSIAVTTPLTVAAAQMTATFAGFEQAMTNTASVANASAAEMTAMEEAAREAGRTTVFSATQAADALYFMASAGYNAGQSVSALDGILDLAAATQSDLAQTSETVASTLSAFGLAASDANRVANTFAATTNYTQATMQKLSDSMRYAGPVASGFGRSLEETAAALGLLYNAGLQGEQAGTTLRQALIALANPAGQAKDALQALGLSVQDVNPTLHSLAEIIDTLKARGISTAQAMQLFGNEAGSGMAAMIAQGGDALRTLTGQITGTDKAAEMATQQMDTLQGSLKRLRGAWDDLAISLAKNLEPTLETIISSATDALKWFSQLSPAAQTLGLALAGAAAAAGPLVFALGQLALALPFLAGPGGWILAAVAALGGLGLAFAATQRDMRGFHQESEATAKATMGQASELGKLLARYDQLKGTPRLSADEHSELKRVMDRIIEIQPAIAKGYNDITKAIDANRSALDTYIQSLTKQGEASIQAAALAYQSQLPSLNRQKETLNREIDRLKSEVTNKLNAPANLEQAKRLLEQAQKATGAAQEKAYRKLWDFLDKTVGGNPVPATQMAILEQWAKEATQGSKALQGLTTNLQAQVQHLQAVEQQIEQGKAALDAYQRLLKGQEPFPTTPVKPAPSAQRTPGQQTPAAAIAAQLDEDFLAFKAKVDKLSPQTYGVLQKAFAAVADGLKSGDIAVQTLAKARAGKLLRTLEEGLIESGGSFTAAADKASTLVKAGYGEIEETLKGLDDKLQRIVEAARTRIQGVLSGQIAPESPADLKLWDANGLDEGARAGEEAVRQIMAEAASALKIAVETTRSRVRAVLEGKAEPESWAEAKLLDAATLEDGQRAGEEAVKRILDDEAKTIEAILETARLHTQAVLAGKAEPQSWAQAKMLDAATLDEGRRAGEDAVRKITDDEAVALKSQVDAARARIQLVLDGKAEPVSWADLKLWDTATLEEGVKAGLDQVNEIIDNAEKSLQDTLALARARMAAILTGKFEIDSWADLKLFDQATLEDGARAGEAEVARLTADEEKALRDAVAMARQRIQAVLEGKAEPVSLADLKLFDYGTLEDGARAGEAEVARLTADEEKALRDAVAMARQRIQAVLSGKVGPTSWAELKLVDSASLEDGAQAGLDVINKRTRAYEAELQLRKTLGQNVLAEELSYAAEAVQATEAGTAERYQALQRYYGLASDAVQQATDEQLNAVRVVLDAEREKWRAMGAAGVEYVALIEAALKKLDQRRGRGKSGEDAAKRRGDFWAGLGNEALGTAGQLGALINAGIQGAAGGGPWGAVAAVGLQLLTSSKQFAQLMDLINPFLQVLANLLGELLTPLIPIVKIYLKLMTPYLQLLSKVFAALAKFLVDWIVRLTPVFNFYGRVFTFLVNVIGKGASLIADIWNWLAKKFNSWGANLPLIENKDWGNQKWTDIQPGDLQVGDTPETGEGGSGSGNAGTQLTNLTGAQRDFFGELLRPVSVLDRLPGWMETIIGLMGGSAGSAAFGASAASATLAQEYQSYLETKQAQISAETILVNNIEHAVFTGPVQVTAGEKSGFRAYVDERVKQLLNGWTQTGGLAARGMGV